MSVAAVSDEQATWHRLSPRMLLVHPVVELIRALPALFGILLAGRTHASAQLWTIGVAVLVAVLSLTRWLTTRLRITADLVQLQHGLLRRQTVTTARDRIRTVDLTAHPLHRVLGLARLVLGTGTNDRKGEGHLVLDGLTVAAANALRDDLLHHVPAAPSVGEPPRPDASTAEPTDTGVDLATLRRSWILFAPFTLSGVLTGAVVWSFYGRAQGEAHVDLLTYGPLRPVRHAFTALAPAQRVAAAAVAVVLFVAVTSTAGYVLAFWNFRLRRLAGGTLQVTRGLLTTRATSVERRRLVGAVISEPLPLRLVGGARAQVVATGLRTGRGAERGGEVLVPPAPTPVVAAVVSAALDGAPAPFAPLMLHGPAARRRRLLRSSAGGVLAAAAAVIAWLTGAPGWLLGVGAAALLGSVALGVDRYRSLGHTIVDGYLVVRGGTLVRRRAAVSADALIGWNIRTTFFQRRSGLASLTATTAAGAQGYHVRDVDLARGLALAEQLTPGLLAPLGVDGPGSRSP